MKDKRRNSLCLCSSGKKFKNCHLDVYEKAERIILLNQRHIKGLIHGIAVKMKEDYKLSGETYSTTVIKDSRENIYTFSVNGYPALKVDYKDIPMDISTVENAEKVSKVTLSDVTYEIIYKKPEIKEAENADNGSNKSA